PNGGNGVAIGDLARDNVVGYPVDADPATMSTTAPSCNSGACNRIADNAGAGVLIAGADNTNNTVRGNRITANDGLGIDLGTTGVTPNDADDADSGANDLVNFPVGVLHYED